MRCILPSSPFGDSQVTMSLTCVKAKEAFDHVVVFQAAKEESLYKALKKLGDNAIMAMITFHDCDIDSLTYDRSDTEKDIPLTRGDKILLCIFQDLILHYHSIGDPIQQDL